MNFSVVLCLFYFSAAAYASIPIILNSESPDRIDFEYLVNVRPDVVRDQSLQNGMDLFEKKMAQFSREIHIVARYDFHTFSVIHVRSRRDYLVAGLRGFPEVQSIEANLRQFVLDGESEEPCLVQTVPEDLWNLARVSSRSTNTSYGNTYSYREADGAGASAYVLDTGVRITHNEFDRERAHHGFIAPSMRDEGYDDLHGHGTHVSGTVLGATYGVAKSASVINVKVIPYSGAGIVSDVVAGLEWVKNDFLEKDGASDGKHLAAVSMSLGFIPPSDAMDAAIQDLYDIGLASVAAAANNNTVSCTYSPARAEAAITVMSTNVNNELAWNSNHGDCTDLLAPEANILSAGIEHDDDTALMSGTSMACPHVTGAILRRMTQVMATTEKRPTPLELREWLL